MRTHYHNISLPAYCAARVWPGSRDVARLLRAALIAGAPPVIRMSAIQSYGGGTSSIKPSGCAIACSYHHKITDNADFRCALVGFSI